MLVSVKNEPYNVYQKLLEGEIFYLTDTKRIKYDDELGFVLEMCNCYYCWNSRNNNIKSQPMKHKHVLLPMFVEVTL